MLLSIEYIKHTEYDTTQCNQETSGRKITLFGYHHGYFLFVVGTQPLNHGPWSRLNSNFLSVQFSITKYIIFRSWKKKTTYDSWTFIWYNNSLFTIMIHWSLFVNRLAFEIAIPYMIHIIFKQIPNKSLNELRGTAKCMIYYYCTFSPVENIRRKMERV